MNGSNPNFSFVGEPTKHVTCFTPNEADQTACLMLTVASATLTQNSGISLWYHVNPEQNASYQHPVKIGNASLPSQVTHTNHIPSSFSFIAGDYNGNLNLLSIVEDSGRETVDIRVDGQWKTHKGALTSSNILEGPTIVTSGEDGCVNICSINGSDLRKTDEIRKDNMSATTIDCVKFLSRNEILVASQGAYVEVWDLRDLRKSQYCLYDQHSEGSSRIWDIDIHPDQPTILAGGDDKGSLLIWDLKKMKNAGGVDPVYCNPTAHASHIWDVKFVHSCPSVIATCSEDGRLLLTDTNAQTITSFGAAEYQNEYILDIPIPLNNFDIWQKNIVISTDNDSLVIIHDFVY
eukprot:TRINITY_DN2121_c3_g1_i1.p1 TRINITY_DN2121_c3_g1~~TRINITY_DN2121_c3_g1_i1.p1  ORF type:complete len:348 (+),score=69.81 TRINITY_DN2121_c3_g1_i1:50-1093(+)